jgi:hypothetical protein
VIARKVIAIALNRIAAIGELSGTQPNTVKL